MRELTPDATVDIRREVCPMTYVRTKLKLETLKAGQLLEVLLAGDEPRKNVPLTARDEGHEIVSQMEQPDGTVRLLIRKAKSQMAKVRIPTPLRSFTKDQEEVAASGKTVGAVVADLDRQYPGIGARILDEKGAVRRYVNIFHNDEDIRFLKDLSTEVADADRITIIPAIAGGCR